VGGCPGYTLSQNGSGLGHNHLDTVLHPFGAVEQQDVLGSCAYIYSEDAHALLSRLSRDAPTE
jgi:hypothetical protein